MHKTPERRTEDTLRWLCTDLDGTLAHSVFPKEGIGEPIWRNVAKVHEAVEAGYKIVIHTSRHWTDYEAIELWLETYGVPCSKIICGKPLAKLYIDDKARHADELSWLP